MDVICRLDRRLISETPSNQISRRTEGHRDEAAHSFWSYGSKTCAFGSINNWMVVSNMFYFDPYLGKISHLTNIFQMGWNHQLDKFACTGVADRYPMTSILNIPKSIVSVFLDVYALSRFGIFWGTAQISQTDIPNRYTKQISHDIPWYPKYIEENNHGIFLLKPVVDTGRISLLNFTWT